MNCTTKEMYSMVLKEYPDIMDIGTVQGAAHQRKDRLQADQKRPDHSAEGGPCLPDSQDARFILSETDERSVNLWVRTLRR